MTAPFGTSAENGKDEHHLEPGSDRHGRSTRRAAAGRSCSHAGTPTAGPSTVPSSTLPITPTTSPSNTSQAPSQTPSRTPSQTPSQTPSCVDQKAEALTLREQAAQLIMTGIDAEGMTSAERSIARAQKPGGLLLMGSGGSASHTRTAMSTASATATVKGIRPFIAADQEGGQIQRLKGSGFDRIPAATVQATWSDEKLTARAKIWGSQLKQANVNLDLAPVADVVPASLGSANAPIGALDRGYGSTPGAVSKHVTAFINGMDAAGVMTSVKHFPGLGRVKGNTDFSSGVVDTVTVRGDDDLAPFAAGIEAKLRHGDGVHRHLHQDRPEEPGGVLAHDHPGHVARRPRVRRGGHH